MGATCNYHKEPEEEIVTNTPEGNILIHKKQVIEFFNYQNTNYSFKDKKFYEATPEHKDLESLITRKKLSTRITTKEYPNGSAKVIIF